jgi:hypothetical protein
MRAMMSTPPVLGTPVEAQPIMARMAELEAARLVEQMEPRDSHGDMIHSGGRALRFHTSLAALRLPHPMAITPRAALADSLRAFDAMTIDDLAALQTVR